jgi:hypothetical protein
LKINVAREFQAFVISVGPCRLVRIALLNFLGVCHSGIQPFPDSAPGVDDGLVVVSVSLIWRNAVVNNESNLCGRRRRKVDRGDLLILVLRLRASQKKEGLLPLLGGEKDASLSEGPPG